MDESLFSARPFSDSDYESWVAVGRAVRPDDPVSAETLRYREESLGSDFERRRYVVEFRTTGSGHRRGSGGESPFNAERGKLWEFILVHPDFQGPGDGSPGYTSGWPRRRRASAPRRFGPWPRNRRPSDEPSFSTAGLRSDVARGNRSWTWELSTLAGSSCAAL